MKDNGEIIEFLKQRDYVMINNALGKGSFGKTVLLKDPFIDELLVAKKYEPDSVDTDTKEKFYKNFLHEIKILYKLNHKNIVRIYNYYAYERISTGYILMEYIEGINIGDFIANYTASHEQISFDNMFSQLIDGFQYIENCGIIHRDIREGNIIIDNAGVVKIIDFGIGKVIGTKSIEDDSLLTKINRSDSDTLPKEYHEGKYTSKTDMFYLAELLNRLLKRAEYVDEINFSYFHILDKMMKNDPDDRYSSFSEIKEAIDKYDFLNIDITDSDKRIYQTFTRSIYFSIKSFIDERKFNNDINRFVSQIEKVLRANCFEDILQDNKEIIRCVVSGAYMYIPTQTISCDETRTFLNWFKKSTSQSQQLILNNIISKLSTIKVEKREPDLPF